MNMKPRPSYPRSTPAPSTTSSTSDWDAPEEGPLSAALREPAISRESTIPRDPPITRESAANREVPATATATTNTTVVDVEDDDASHFVADERYEEIKRGET